MLSNKSKRRKMAKEVALVVGGTSGIGKAQVYRWVTEGYEVVFCGRSVETGKTIAADANATFIKCDVTIATEVESMFEQIKSKFGKLDVLLNNVGVGGPVMRFHEIELKDVQSQYEVNQLGAWHVLKYGLKLMVEIGNGGRIVNTTSIAGITACLVRLGGTATYAAAKAALTSMTQNVAMEYIKDKIRVNAVAPTAVETEFIRKYLGSAPDQEAVKAAINSCNPMAACHGEMVQTSDVTGVISFLAGPDAKFINGQTIAIDGGYTIQ